MSDHHMPDVRVAKAERDKRRRFLKVATRRTQRVIDTIHQLSKCANTASYEYKPMEVARMFEAIEKELRVAEGRFRDEHFDHFSFKVESE